MVPKPASSSHGNGSAQPTISAFFTKTATTSPVGPSSASKKTNVSSLQTRSETLKTSHHDQDHDRDPIQQISSQSSDEYSIIDFTDYRSPSPQLEPARKKQKVDDGDSGRNGNVSNKSGIQSEPIEVNDDEVEEIQGPADIVEKRAPPSLQTRRDHLPTAPHQPISSNTSSSSAMKSTISPFFQPRSSTTSSLSSAAKTPFSLASSSATTSAQARNRRASAITAVVNPARYVLSKYKAPTIEVLYMAAGPDRHPTGGNGEIPTASEREGEGGLDEMEAVPDSQAPVVSMSNSGKAFENFAIAIGNTQQPKSRDPNVDDPASESDSISQPQTQTEAQKRRHDAWKSRMADPRGLIPRRRSLTLDEAAGRTVRALANGGDGSEMMGEGDRLADSEGPDHDTTVIRGQDMLDVDAESETTEPLTMADRKKRGAVEGPTAAGKGRKSKPKEDVGPSGLPYTPLEKQYLEIKKANPDVLILMEVGYKFRFFEEDAKIAAKELGIAAFPLRNFYSASIPTHRLTIHVKKLVEQGYLVGVVRQMETAALKAAGDTKGKPFERKLTNLYTAATYVDELSTVDSGMGSAFMENISQPTNAFVCLNETLQGGMGPDDRVKISLLAVYPQTGEVLYDEFDDGYLRTELETRFAHLVPSEILIPDVKLSKPSEKVVVQFSGNARNASGPRVRLERACFKNYQKSFEDVRKYCGQKPTVGDTIEIEHEHEAECARPPSNHQQDRLETIADISKPLTIVLAAAMRHLDRFGLVNPLTHISGFSKFSQRAHMVLSTNTLTNLEVYRNNTDFREKGSLIWILDQTKTKMGKRLLREWVGRPLTNEKLIRLRLDAVEEIFKTNTVTIEKIQGLLKNMPDLGRGLARISYGKTTPPEMATILVSLKRIGHEFDEDGPVTGMPKSKLLSEIVLALPRIREPAMRYLQAINTKAAHENDIPNLFVDPERYPDIQRAKDAIAGSEKAMMDHLAEVKTKVKHGVSYVTVAGIEFLIEMKQKERVPDGWVKISSTKHFVRYHTPFVLQNLKRLEQSRESLQLACKSAFTEWQKEILQDYQVLRNAVVKLAEFDCLQSFAVVASRGEYIKPTFVEKDQLVLQGARHPMVEASLTNDYVPNDVNFSEEGKRTMIITGPNTSGKSTCVRATALILLMSQIGSFVPAANAELSIHDAIHTRMGASDDLGRGKSTFMVELTETSEILKLATKQSLVILDELGRGTSTHDGSAIAFAVLDQLVQVGSTTMFITHFPNVALDTIARHPSHVGNFHMSFAEESSEAAGNDIICLYKLVPGLASRSFGVWVGRLAGLPEPVLDRAQEKGDELRMQIQLAGGKRRVARLTREQGLDFEKAVEWLGVAKDVLYPPIPR